MNKREKRLSFNSLFTFFCRIEGFAFLQTETFVAQLSISVKHWMYSNMLLMTPRCVVI